MKQRPFLLQAATLFSSLFLVGGLVAYRTGAFDRLMGVGNPSTLSLLESDLEENVSDGPKQAEHIFMSGSKTMNFLVSPSSIPGSQPPSSSEPPKQGPFMYVQGVVKGNGGPPEDTVVPALRPKLPDSLPCPMTESAAPIK